MSITIGEAPAARSAASSQATRAAAAAEIGELVIQWKQCKNKREREIIFHRIHTLSLPRAIIMYRSVSPLRRHVMVNETAAFVQRKRRLRLNSRFFGDEGQMHSGVNLSIYRAAERFDGRGRFDSFLYSCVRSQAIDTARMITRNECPNGSPLLPIGHAKNIAAASDVDARLIERDEFNAWRRATRRLTATERHVFRRRHLLRFSYAEIVKSLKRFLPRPRGWTVGHVENALVRAMEKMREQAREAPG